MATTTKKIARSALRCRKTIMDLIGKRDLKIIDTATTDLFDPPPS